MKNIKQKGVSLIELIVVMAIIAILTAVAIVSYTAFIKRAKDTKASQELTQVYNLIYMEADQRTIQVGTNVNGDTALFVTTSGNKIVLMFNDAPSEHLTTGWNPNDINNWENEDKWNILIRNLIDYVTDDIGMFSGLFELDPNEDTAIFNEVYNDVEVVRERNITYILENDEELRSKKELIVTTVNDVETATVFLNDIEDHDGKLVPVGRVSNPDEVEELSVELWFVWTASAGFVLSEEFVGNLEITYNISIYNTAMTEAEILAANRIINGLDGGTPLFIVDFIHYNSWVISTDYPDLIEATLRFNREPKDAYEYSLIKNNDVKIEFVISIKDIKITEKP